MSYGPPTHRLVITDKDNRQRRTRAGVAWQNEKGWISIVLNPGIKLSYDELEDRLFLSLYPIDQREESHIETAGLDRNEGKAELGEDDLPF